MNMAHHRRKLSTEDVNRIRTLYQARVPLTQIARAFNVSSSALKGYVHDVPKLPLETIAMNMQKAAFTHYQIHLTQKARAISEAMEEAADR